MNNIVESNFEKDLSPRAADFFKWSDNHIGGFVTPTRKPTRKHDDETRRISTDDLKELYEFDVNAAIHNVSGWGKCSSM